MNDKLPVLVTGCPRSGTKYIAKVLKLACGLDIYHERSRGKDGIVDWKYGDPFTPKHRFNTVLHQVRNPIDVINSLCTISPDSRQFMEEQVVPIEPSDSPIVRLMKYWYFWCYTCETVAVYTYRVENIENELDTICELLGVACDLDVFKTISKDVNTRKPLPTYGCITWDDLEKEHKVLHGYIANLASQYGYTV